ncbi:hypothetical protein [Nonomuraea sp. NPDC001831]|uniref:hypothetical protein n=1 Tax=Nonomuraea sp. NPDC001831 TaxID=3364340 RepID=UPI00367F5280
MAASANANSTAEASGSLSVRTDHDERGAGGDLDEPPSRRAFVQVGLHPTPELVERC